MGVYDTGRGPDPVECCRSMLKQEAGCNPFVIKVGETPIHERHQLLPSVVGAADRRGTDILGQTQRDGPE